MKKQLWHFRLGVIGAMSVACTWLPRRRRMRSG